jgi:hypothetical protein
VVRKSGSTCPEPELRKANHPAIKPIASEPLTFTAKVFHGIAPELMKAILFTAWRNTPPSPAPRNTTE